MYAYLKATQSEKRSAKTDIFRTKTLRRFFEGRDMTELKGRDTRAYITFRKNEGVSNSTINRELALLSGAINYANSEWDWELPNFVIGRRLREPEGRVRWISRVEAANLIKAAEQSKSPVLADFIRLAIHTGCRSGELLGLEWRRVDMSRRLIYLDAEHTKTAKRRSVPLNDDAREALANRSRFRSAHCSDSPWIFCNQSGCRVANVKRAFEGACKRAGIKDFRIHDLRHTCAAWLVSAGVPLAEVRDVLGHASVTMTERYAHLEPENLRHAVTQLSHGKSRFGHVFAATNDA